MKNKTIFTLFLIITAAFILRFYNLDKPEGLWNDEYTGWYIASRPSFSEFLSCVSKNCHTPLYYIFLKLWISFFPDTDLSLRISSASVSILLVISMFFLGREYKNEKTGLLCALFTALSSFYIYFAQEVRLYSLLGLVSALTAFMCLKTLKTGKKHHFAIFAAINAVLCALHTLGLIFSFFIILFTVIYLYKNFDEWKNILKNSKKALMYIFPFLCVLLLISPFILSILFSTSLSQFWGGFSYTKTAFSFIDYFSPMQFNITNSPDTFRMYLFRNGHLNYPFAVFALFPSFIGFCAVLKAFLLRSKILNLLLFSSAAFFIVLLIISASGRMILITKYSSEIYPVLILAFSAGILSIQNKFIRNAVLAAYFGLSLVYLYFSPEAAYKIERREGNRAPVMLIQKAGLRKSDFILFTYYDYDKFQRYLKDYNYDNILSVSKFNFNIPVFGNSSYNQVIWNGKSIYRDKFKEFPNQSVIKWTRENIINNMKQGDKIGIVTLRGVSFLSNDDIIQIAQDDKKYNKTSFVFLAFSSLKNSLMYVFNEGFELESTLHWGDWTLTVYKKTE